MVGGVYSAAVGVLAFGILVWAVWKKKKGNGWGVAVMVSGAVVGASPTIQAFLPSIINPPVSWIAQFVTGSPASDAVAYGAYSAAAVLLAGFITWLVWRDGVVKTWELWLLMVASMVFGTSWVVASWLPGVLNGIAAFLTSGL